MQEVNGHLVRVVREVRDRTENILTECGMLVAEVVQVNVAEEGQGNAVESEGEQPALEGEVELAGSVMT